MYQGKVIRLRAYCKEDAKLAQTYLNDAETRSFLAPNVPFPYTLGDEESWVASQGVGSKDYNFAIETLDGDRYIGGCGLVDLDWKNRHSKVGIFIGDKTLWGKGYGTDAMNVLLDFIFNEMGLLKVMLDVYDFNKRAIKSYEKSGFVVEGVRKKELYRGGAFHDIIRMIKFSPLEVY